MCFKSPVHVVCCACQANVDAQREEKAGWCVLCGFGARTICLSVCCLLCVCGLCAVSASVCVFRMESRVCTCLGVLCRCAAGLNVKETDTRDQGP